MSAGGEAKVHTIDFGLFWEHASYFIVDKLKEGVTLELIINDEISRGWTFYSCEFTGHYDIILRRPINDEIGTAEYVRVDFADDGEEIHFIQYIVIQNDNDYVGMGKERFDALR